MQQAEALELFTNVLRRDLVPAEKAPALQLAGAVGFLPLALNLAAMRVRSGMWTWEQLTKALRQEIARLDGLAGARRLLAKQTGLEASLLLSLRYLQSNYKKATQLFAWFGVLPEDVLLNPSMMGTIWQMDKREAADHLELFWAEALLLTTSPGYRLHDLFHDMAQRLLTISPPEGIGISLPEAHKRLLENYNKLLPSSAESRVTWPALKSDGYIHEHLVWHMEKASQASLIEALLKAEGTGEQNAWYETREGLGQTAGYIEDIRRAWRLVQEHSHQSRQWDKPISTLGLEIRYVLMLTSLNSLAANIPIPLIANLVKYEVWKPIVGLTYIIQIPASKTRSKGLISIAPYLAADQLQEALIVAQEIEDPSCRAQALSAIAPYFSDFQKRLQVLQQALTVARRIKEPSYRARTLSAIAPHLTIDQLQEALIATREIKEASARTRAQSSIVSSLATAGKVHEAMAITREIENLSSRAQVMSAIAPYLNDDQLQETLTAAQEIKVPYYRARALSIVGSHLNDDQKRLQILQEALVLIRKIKNSSSYARALSTISPHLNDDQLQQVLAAAREIKEPSFHAQVMSTLAPHLNDDQERLQILQEALVITRKITDSSSYARTLSTISPHLTVNQLQEALAATREIQEPSSRDQALSGIASSLTKAGKIQEALTIAQEIENTYFHDLVLSGIAPSLATAGKVQEALIVAREIPDPSSRTKAISAIVSSLATAGKIQEALTVAREIENTSSRAKALNDIAPNLHKASIKQFYLLWSDLLKIAVVYTREDMLSLLSHLPLVLILQGGEEAMNEVIQALRDVTRWW